MESEQTKRLERNPALKCGINSALAESRPVTMPTREQVAESAARSWYNSQYPGGEYNWEYMRPEKRAMWLAVADAILALFAQEAK